MCAVQNHVIYTATASFIVEVIQKIKSNNSENSLSPSKNQSRLYEHLRDISQLASKLIKLANKLLEQRYAIK